MKKVDHVSKKKTGKLDIALDFVLIVLNVVNFGLDIANFFMEKEKN